MPNERKHKFILESPNAETERELKAVLTAAIRKAKEMNQPLIYRNNLCVKPSLFIHKYPNGEEFLVEQDVNTLSEKKVRVLR